MKQHKIKLGVSLYSFSTEFISDRLDLEGVLKRANEMGYKGSKLWRPKWFRNIHILLTNGWSILPVC